MSAKAQDVDLQARIALSRKHAAEIHETSGRRVSAPIRSAFVRDLTGGQQPTCLSRLVGMRGRGGEVPLKLLIALIWRSASPPFDTRISARKWAELLGLSDAAHLGARRVTDGFQTLAGLNLIDIEKRRGEASIITLLEESGTGAEYTLPKGRGDLYFHIPAQLWLTGKIQLLSAPAIGMLMAVLAELDPKDPQRHVWWSTKVFPQRIGLSPSSRSRGTKELIEAGLLEVKRVPIPTTANRTSFSEERVRTLYIPTGDALPAATKKTVIDNAKSSTSRGARKRLSRTPKAREPGSSRVLKRTT